MTCERVDFRHLCGMVECTRIGRAAMARGKRKRQHQDLFGVTADKIVYGSRIAFYDRLNQPVEGNRFDGRLETAAEQFYKKHGRKGLQIGVFFRMIYFAYFDDISSQRTIAWRCKNKCSYVVARESAGETLTMRAA